MPTVILLDVSLSMCRKASRRLTNGSDSNQEGPVIKALASSGVGILCDYFAQHAQLEHVALVVFSSLYEIKHAFTRDHEGIKSSAHSLEVYDKSNIVNALRGVSNMKLEEWAQSGPINIILITDGLLYNTDTHPAQYELDRDVIDYEFRDLPLKELEGLFKFDCKLQVVCLTSARDSALKQSLQFFKKLVTVVDNSTTDCPVLTSSNSLKNFKRSAIWLPESNSLDVAREEVESIFTSIAELNYKPYNVTLSCGNLSSMVMLSPKPADYLVEPLKNDFDDLKIEEQAKKGARETYVSALNKKRLFVLSDDINICGFISMNEVASPPITTRHTVFPILHQRYNETAKAEQILSQDPNAYSKSLHQTYPLEQEDTSNLVKGEKSFKTKGRNSNQSAPLGDSHHIEKDITKRPSFCVLLHSCLKQENMVALCLVGKSEETNEEWFGILHSQTDTKKRSSLMLSLLLPGPNPILWLPNFKTLGSAMLNSDLPPAILDRIAGSGSKESSSSNLTSGKSSSKSYSNNSVIWLDPESVQMDVQKIVRHAKRAPEKAPHFYRELNRIRKAAISYGFYDILYGLASILEREKSIMLSVDTTKSSNTEVIKHIDHVISCLRTNLNDASFDINIRPPVA